MELGRVIYESYRIRHELVKESLEKERRDSGRVLEVTNLNAKTEDELRQLYPGVALSTACVRHYGYRLFCGDQGEEELLLPIFAYMLSWQNTDEAAINIMRKICLSTFSADEATVGCLLAISSAAYSTASRMGLSLAGYIFSCLGIDIGDNEAFVSRLLDNADLRKVAVTADTTRVCFGTAYAELYSIDDVVVKLEQLMSAVATVCDLCGFTYQEMIKLYLVYAIRLCKKSQRAYLILNRDQFDDLYKVYNYNNPSARIQWLRTKVIPRYVLSSLASEKNICKAMSRLTSAVGNTIRTTHDYSIVRENNSDSVTFHVRYHDSYGTFLMHKSRHNLCTSTATYSLQLAIIVYLDIFTRSTYPVSEPVKQQLLSRCNEVFDTQQFPIEEDMSVYPENGYHLCKLYRYLDTYCVFRLINGKLEYINIDKNEVVCSVPDYESFIKDTDEDVCTSARADVAKVLGDSISAPDLDRVLKALRCTGHLK